MTIPIDLLGLARCLECCGALQLADLGERAGYPELGPDGLLDCLDCGERYPLIAGTLRLLPRAMRPQLWVQYPRAAATLSDAGVAGPTGPDLKQRSVKTRTADSFAYEWERFGGLREEWRKNFTDYMKPHTPESFSRRLVLDVGTGSGRHAFHAAELGARVVAVDIGRSIDVARANLPADVLTVQADAEELPFAPRSFDFVMSIGVLHHLADPHRALHNMVQLTANGGHVHIYLYWLPERHWHARLLRAVTIARKVTVHLPHRLLHALCLPTAALLAVVIVGPYRVLCRIPRLGHIAESFPLKTYADYPFKVLMNDQFDRFSAPIERRYTRVEVLGMLKQVGLADAIVLANHGWIGDGLVRAKS